MTQIDPTLEPESERFSVLFKWAWQGYVRKQRWWLLLALMFMALEGSMLGALSYMMQPMFDTVFIEGNTSAMWTVGFVIMGIFAMRGLAGIVQKVIFAHIALNTTSELKFDLLDHLMRQDGRFFETNPPGLLIQRINGDVGGISAIWNTIITGAAHVSDFAEKLPARLVAVGRAAPAGGHRTRVAAGHADPASGRSNLGS